MEGKEDYPIDDLDLDPALIDVMVPTNGSKRLKSCLNCKNQSDKVCQCCDNYLYR